MKATDDIIKLYSIKTGKLHKQNSGQPHEALETIPHN